MNLEVAQPWYGYLYGSFYADFAEGEKLMRNRQEDICSVESLENTKPVVLTSLGTLRSQEGNSEEDVDLKMCLSSHSASQLKFSLTYVISVEFQMETLKKIYVGISALGAREFWWFHFAVLQRTDEKNQYKVLKRPCQDIVLPTRSFVFPPCHLRRRLGSPEVPLNLRGRF